ncbi:MAG: aspartate aminotransferase family protein [Peptostreptococcaceae bacterium]
MELKTLNIKEKYNEFFMGTYDQLPITILDGKGSKLYDSENKEYIDFTSGIGVSSLGYNHEKLKNTLHNQIEKIIHISNIVFNEPLIELGEKIVSISDMGKVFFCNSGTEANECAIKIARKYSYDKYGENRDVVVSLKDSFHGRTMGALMATDNEKYQKGFFEKPKSFKYVDKYNLENLKFEIDKSVCAIIVEIIQGESGVYPIELEFIKSVEAICKEKDIILICDEVQCGIGRTGKLFAYEHYNIKPDLVTMAKGLGGGIPIGGVLAGKKAEDVFVKGSHGSTFGGNPLAMSAAITVLNEIDKDEFYDEVCKKGKVITDYIKNLNKETITDVRGLGLMIGIETNLDISEVQKNALEKGLLVLTAGKNTIRLLPPLTISYDEIYKGLEVLKGCF